MSVCAMASRTGSGTAGMFTLGIAWIVPCNKPAAKVWALTCIFSLLCRRFLASSDYFFTCNAYLILCACGDILFIIN